MSPGPERYLSLYANIPISQPELLNGLENWLQLGLLSDRHVRELCRQYLVCPVPVPETEPEAELKLLTVNPAQRKEAQEPIAAFNAEPPAESTAQRHGWMSQFLQGLMNEVSVIWLLCLGVFLVVVSSGVLAASQWQHVPPIGQYGILFGYTIAFVVASLWTGAQPQLQVTSWMLQIASLLIIPVNFWMMDGFHLLQTPLGMGIAVIAALTLSAATFKLMPRPPNPTLVIANVIGLSWLHWGWGWAHLPLIATYVGCIGTSLVLFQQDRRSLSSTDSDLTQPWWVRFVQSDIVLPFAVLLLLFRASVVEAVPLQQLGLALGICGWLLCWLSRKNQAKQTWYWIGAGLLICGWFASFAAEPPWQALLVSGLGLWLLGDRLLRYRQPREVVGIVLLGLAGVGLLVRTIPLEMRNSVIAMCTAGFGPLGMPDALWGVGLYPYLWGVLGLAHRLRRWQQPVLVRTAHTLAWILGVGLVGVSVVNPSLRSLSLWLALGTLIVTLRQQPSVGRVLVNIVHLVGLAAVASTLDNLAPQFAMHQWGVAAIIGMVLEWIALLWLARSPLWKESTWFVGLGLAGLGYLLLFVSIGLRSAGWGSATLLIPTALTALIFFPQFQWIEQAIGLSVASAIAVQLLTFEAVIPRLIGLALGAVLMTLNTIRRPQLLTAVLSVGFGLTFCYATGWEVLIQRRFQDWVMLSVGLLWALVGLRQVLSRYDWNVSQPFKRVFDGWAIAVVLWTSLPTVAYGLFIMSGLVRDSFAGIYPVANLLMLGALWYRYRQAPAQGWFVGIAWTVEMVLISSLTYWKQPLSAAIATITLGILSVLVGEWQVRRTGESYPWSWNLIPLGYGAFGWLLSISEWSATSGLYPIALALIAMGVGRRQPQWMPVTLLGLAALSFGSFELLLYPLLKAQGGQAGDGYVALGAMGLGFAIAEYPLERGGTRVLNLAPNILKIYGQIHWGLASVLLAIALSLPLSTTGEWLWGLEMLLLGGYALLQGRQQAPWIYLGLIEFFAALGETLYVHIPSAQLLPWAAAIASGVALGLYSLPWQRWGWPKSPFLHVALAVPLLVAMFTASAINTSTLLLTGGFYGWIAFVSQTTRLSYVGLALANVAALRLLSELHLTSQVWGVSLVGLSLLFVAQIDPAFRSPSRREIRHLLRCFAVGLISVTVLYESDPHFWGGLLAIALSLGLVVMGLLLRVRAFLYLGTLTFIAKVVRIIWIFIADESLVLWGLGIAVGLLLIWVAATFEARRSQVTALLQYWMSELEQWQ
jgi:hypothetical protein